MLGPMLGDVENQRLEIHGGIKLSFFNGAPHFCWIKETMASKPAVHTKIRSP